MDATKLTQGPIGRRLLVFALPVLGAQILQALSASVNSFWVGRFLGEAALAATLNANMIMLLLIGTFIGVNTATTILVGQRVGAHDLALARRVVGTSASFLLSLVLLVSVIGFIVSRSLLAAMGTPEASLTSAIAYLRIIFFAMPFIYMTLFVMSVLRGAGDSTTPLKFMFLSVVMDCILNPVFIFGIGPVPPLGVAGSALATLCSQAVSLGGLLMWLYARRHPLVLRGSDLSHLRVDWQIARGLLRKGLPMGAEVLVTSLSGLLMITLVNHQGVDTVAAFGASIQAWTYIQVCAYAVSMAVSAMAAQNIGAAAWPRVDATARAGMLLNVVIIAVLIGLLALFSEQVLGAFLPRHAQGLAIAVHMNQIVSVSFLFFGVSLVLLAIIRAAGAVAVPLTIMSVSMLLVRIPSAALLTQVWQADGIWWSFPISSAFAAALAMLYYRHGNWRSKEFLPSSPAQVAQGK